MNRRKFLSGLFAVAAARAANVWGESPSTQPAGRTVRVAVWDEQQPEQKKAYDNFLGNAIADHLRSRPGFSVQSVKFADPEQGLSEEVLDSCEVLVYWSHYRTNPAVKLVAARRVVDRIKAGDLSMVTLHSAHWSEPFVQAMRDRATEDALAALTDQERSSVEVSYVTPKRFVVPHRGAPLTPSTRRWVGPDGKLHLEITLPS